MVHIKDVSLEFMYIEKWFEQFRNSMVTYGYKIVLDNFKQMFLCSQFSNFTTDK
jgi:hypothetical protein